jgi:hypothetical protein
MQRQFAAQIALQVVLELEPRIRLVSRRCRGRIKLFQSVEFCSRQVPSSVSVSPSIPWAQWRGGGNTYTRQTHESASSLARAVWRACGRRGARDRRLWPCAAEPRIDRGSGSGAVGVPNPPSASGALLAAPVRSPSPSNRRVAVAGR